MHHPDEIKVKVQYCIATIGLVNINFRKKEKFTVNMNRAECSGVRNSSIIYSELFK